MKRVWWVVVCLSLAAPPIQPARADHPAGVGLPDSWYVDDFWYEQDELRHQQLGIAEVPHYFNSQPGGGLNETKKNRVREAINEWGFYSSFPPNPNQLMPVMLYDNGNLLLDTLSTAETPRALHSSVRT